MTSGPRADCHRAALLQPRAMKSAPSNDPLHGITLEQIVTELSAQLGWTELGRRIPVRCFLYDPSVKSSLIFLRRTPWARAKVEALYRERVRAVRVAEAAQPVRESPKAGA